MPQETAESCFALNNDETRRWMVAAMIALGFVLPALFADRLYFARVTALAAAPPSPDILKRSGTAGVGAALALQIMVLLFSIGALDSQFYIIRARVSEGIYVGLSYTQPLRDYVKQHEGRLPASIEEIASAPPPSTMRAVELERDGSIRAVFGKGIAKLAGHSVRVTPKWKDREIVGWSCGSDDINPRCLPSKCEPAR